MDATREQQVPCQRTPELWFAASPEALETAKERCRPCRLRESCLAGALQRREPWGVWGGELFWDGRVIARKRAPGRPRKHAAA